MLFARFILMFLVAVISSTPLSGWGAGGAAADEPDQAPVEVHSTNRPQPAVGSDGRVHIAYELQVTNFYESTGPLRLQRVAIFGGASAEPLLDLRGPEVRSLLAESPTGASTPDVTIEGGKRRVLFVWLQLPVSGAPPSLRQQLDFLAQDGKRQRASVRVALNRARPIAIAAPLRGRWLANEGPGNSASHHWSGVTAIGGQVTVPQRFAIDWFGLDAQGRTTTVASESLATSTDADWAGFGSDVLAVGNGIVRAARDGVADGTPLAPMPSPANLTNETLYGNFVVLEIAKGVFVHYAHLKNGSVKVKRGDRVRLGAVIGQVGQTGSAGAPHLHLHLSNAANFENSEGLPFVFDKFKVAGKLGIDQTFGAAAGGVLQRPTPHRREMPLDGDVVEFPGLRR